VQAKKILAVEHAAGTAVSRPKRFVSSWWLLTRFTLVSVAGIAVLVMAFAVQHRPTFLVDDSYVETPKIDPKHADLPANQFGHALLDRNWLKVERYLAADTADRDYIENFKLNPTVRALVSSDCTSKEITRTQVTEPAAQSTEFGVRLQMSRMCTTTADPFNSVDFRIAPRGSEWYYVAGTIHLEHP
jgi:hypothetical protein